MAPAPVQSFKPSKELRDVRVVVVDDDRRIANLVRSVLLGLGFQHVHVLHDGQDGIDYLKINLADLIICDWQMEPVSGMDMVQFLRRESTNHNRVVPIIMLSGNSEKPQVETARDAGVTEYVIKPFTAKSLCSRIIAVIDSPRSFIIAPKFAGHNRRRKSLPAAQERRKSRGTKPNQPPKA